MYIVLGLDMVNYIYIYIGSLASDRHSWSHSPPNPQPASVVRVFLAATTDFTGVVCVEGGAARFCIKASARESSASTVHVYMCLLLGLAFMQTCHAYVLKA